MDIILDILSYAALVALAVVVVLFFMRPIARDRMLAKGIRSTIAMMFLIMLVVPFSINGIAIILGIEAADMVGGQNGLRTDSLFLSVMYHFTDPGNLQEANGNGRIVAWVCALLGIFLFAGLMVSTIVSILDQRANLWRKGLLRYNCNFNNYVVVIGNNEQLINVIKKSLDKGANYVLVMTESDVEKLRMHIDSRLTEKEEKRVVMYYGDMTSYEEIKSLKLERAREIYVIGEGDKESSNHDADVMRCVEHISTYKKKKHKGGKLNCYVSIDHQSTYARLKYSKIELDENLRFLPFNIYESWAKKVLVDHEAVVADKKIEYECLSGDGIGVGSDKKVHLIIMGINEMGRALAIEAAQLAHYPNFIKDSSRRTTITLIDTNAKEEAEYFKARYAYLFDLCRSRVVDAEKDEFGKGWHDPVACENSKFRHLTKDSKNFIDVEYEFIQGRVASDAIRNYLANAVADETNICTVAICFSQLQKSLATAAYLPDVVLEKSNQVLVYQSNDVADIIEKLRTGNGKYGKLKPFGMLECSYEYDSVENIRAQLVNWVYNSEILKSREIESITFAEIEEEIEQYWDEIKNKLDFKWSSAFNADAFGEKLHSVGSGLNEDVDSQRRKLQQHKDAMAEVEHNRWVVERLMMGYRALTVEERAIFDTEEYRYPINKDVKDKKEKNKKEYKDQKRAHLDICSNDVVKEVDSDVVQNDYRLVGAIPEILRLEREYAAKSQRDEC